MAWWNPFSNRIITASEEPTIPIRTTASRRGDSPFAVMAAGIDEIVKNTEALRGAFDHTNEFDLYDDMLNYDPELNGAVRTISLTANKYQVIGGKNSAIRNAIKELTEETLDFDDLLINGMRNLMVYGNDISKYIGRTGVGLTELQSLPIAQITVMDDRTGSTQTDKENAIMKATKYLLREQARDPQEFSADEILHIRIDYRSNWLRDRLGRWTYGVWGASRFTALKQAIRAKYNSMNNRIALEDSLTKQYITIGPEAVENINDPDEAEARLNYVMDSVGSLLDGLRSDQVPILPHYVKMEFVDLKNTIPDNAGFMDSVNADISSVLHVPRVSMGQERGSTFAATYNASQWSVQAIRRLQSILAQSMQALFSKHLELLGIDHINGDLPKVMFEPMDEESPFEQTRRATMAFESGITTLNEARFDLSLPAEKASIGKQRYNAPTSDSNVGELPRDKENKPPEESESGV